MLLSKRVTGNNLLGILSHRPISSILNRCLTQEVADVQRRKIVGYLAPRPEKYSSKSNHLNVLSCKLIARCSSSNSTGFSITQELTPLQFEKISDETLDSLTEYFDQLIENAVHLTDADVSYGDGVLTVKFGNPHGTYVINRQTPNKQIWLSSPKSGPKRYDFINGKWIYKHDGKTLHELLNNEIPAIIRNQANFDKCSFSGKERDAAMNSL
ncbi:frataxin [Xylocopa sonorina]|uniref:frataxin n=1 Tax=Xylocopa sonorina TaxID=1818115 RepID=UPI00403AC466